MPALNISFTDEELAQLRDRARTQGVSMKTLAHDTVVRSDAAAEADALIWAAYEKCKAASAGLLRRLADK
jgi:hypothetical protein